jgi:hypothetical protein
MVSSSLIPTVLCQSTPEPTTSLARPVPLPTALGASRQELGTHLRRSHRQSGGHRRAALGRLGSQLGEQSHPSERPAPPHSPSPFPSTPRSSSVRSAATRAAISTELYVRPPLLTRANSCTRSTAAPSAVQDRTPSPRLERQRYAESRSRNHPEGTSIPRPRCKSPVCRQKRE